MEKLVLTEVADRIAYLSLNRPEKRNALNPEMVLALKQAINWAYQNSDIKVIVIKSTSKVFSAGADLQHLQNLQHFSVAENLADSNSLRELFELIYCGPKVVIALVEGTAIAGGCGLATVCDFVFAVPEAGFAYTEVKIGFIPAIVMVFLLRKTGETRAKELLLTGKLITAGEAAEAGIVYQIYPPLEVGAKVHQFAMQLCTDCSAQSLASAKQMISKVQGMNLADALSYASEMNAASRATSDCKKGIAAFLSKENLKW